MTYLYKPSIWSLLLTPISWLLSLLVWLRQFLYKVGVFKVTKATIPVIIVGNITVGGTGKSPLVNYLVSALQVKGFRPGIVSRGYGGKSNTYPLCIEESTPTEIAGDEAKMLFEKCHVPVVVDPNRVQAVQYMQENTNCNVIISDDGLQHYAMGRDMELVLIDTQRGLGNGLLLPLGPLREPARRLNSVNAIINNFRFDETYESNAETKVPQFQASFQSVGFVSVADTAKQLSIEDMQRLIVSTESPALAVAGIGNPHSFFDFLNNNCLNINTVAYADHHVFTPSNFDNTEQIILMTEKDAIKCRDIGLPNAWYLAIEMQVSPNLADFCLEQLALENN